MKQRHGTKRHVFRGERVGIRNIFCRCSDVGMADGNALRASRAPAGVQHQRYIVRAGEIRGARRPRRVLQPDKSIFVHQDRVDRDFTQGRLARSIRSLRRADQNFRGRVFQIKTEFIFTISGIERGGRSRQGRGKKAYNRRQAAGHHGRHAVTTADSRAG